jgi:predicted Zn-dependent peptidase
MKSTKLKNGVKIIYDNVNTINTVALGIFFGIGSKNEEKEKHGITHFIEHMLFKSNLYYKNKSAVTEIEKKGAIVNAFTTKEYTCIYTKALKTEIKLIVDILYKMSFSPVFNNEEIEIEKKVVLNEILKNKENNYNLVHENIFKIALGKHPLARNILGDEESINKFNSEILFDYYQKRFSEAPIVVSLSGNIDDELKQTVEELFSCIPSRMEKYKGIEEIVSFSKEEKIVKKNDILQNHLCLGYRINSYEDPKIFPLMVFNHILGEGQMSFLSRYMREKMGMVYSIGSTTYLYKEGGVLTVNIASSSSNDINFIKNTLINLLESSYLKELSSDLVSIAKYQIKSRLVFALENSMSRMLDFGKNAILDIDSGNNASSINYSDINEVIKSIDNVIIEEVEGICNDFLMTKPSISIITDK